jgi:hypothetical protein
MSGRKAYRYKAEWRVYIPTGCYICETPLEVSGGVMVHYGPGLFSAYCLNCVKALGAAVEKADPTFMAEARRQTPKLEG